MRLSILDQSPISTNQTAKEALNESIVLAQKGEELGYTRYWIAEHHDLPGLACSAPEVMLSYIGAKTNTIRIGSGAILLPYYKPFKIAEVFNMLATLFPNRIDIGIGRAPGGTAEASNALSDAFLQNVWNLPSLIRDLLHFIDDTHPKENEFSKVSASPMPEIAPVSWLLGTSEKSALLAAENGMPYTFGHFMSDNNGSAIVKKYLDHFTCRKEGEKPQVIVTVSAICAETTEKAEEIALSSLIWSIQREKGEARQGVPSIQDAKRYKLTVKEIETLEQMKGKMIIGDSREVKRQLIELQDRYKANEIMINTITYSQEERVQSYDLIAKEMFA